METPREPAWAWLLAGLLAALTWREARAPPPPDLPEGAEERWALEPDPARMAPRELRRLPGLGERRAIAAAQARFAHEPAAGRLEWSDVPGIGEETAAKVAAWLAEHGQAGAPLVEAAARGP